MLSNSKKRIKKYSLYRRTLSINSFVVIITFFNLDLVILLFILSVPWVYCSYCYINLHNFVFSYHHHTSSFLSKGKLGDLIASNRITQ